MKITIFVSSLIIFFSCQSKTEEQNPQKAKQLYSKGMKILDDRIAIQANNRENAMELNKRAIEMFSAAYKADTTFSDAALFASECTMYGKDFQECIYWTTKLMNLDTSQQNIVFCTNRIKDCKEQLSK
ncbi:MAG: hypothetical protein J7502_06520 [Flavisolibacter sp.]|nr:hypothetical protein [Flavisolibacter sp.]